MAELWVEEPSPPTPTLLAWTSWEENKISIIELGTKQKFSTFDGVQLRKMRGILETNQANPYPITVHKTAAAVTPM